jgi:hypothetical protein
MARSPLHPPPPPAPATNTTTNPARPTLRIQAALLGKIKRCRGAREEWWVCECCKRTNQCLAVVSYAEFMALDLEQTEAVLRCGECPNQSSGHYGTPPGGQRTLSFVACPLPRSLHRAALFPLTHTLAWLPWAGHCKATRVWFCPHDTCRGAGPLEVASIQTEAVYETMTCPDCRKAPVDLWPCPVCDTVSSGL